MKAKRGAGRGSRGRARGFKTRPKSTASTPEAPSRLRARIASLEKKLARANEKLDRARLRQETRDELEVSREAYVNLFDSAPISYLEHDGRGVIRSLNLTAARLLGRKREHLVGRPMLVIIAKADRRRFLQHLAQLRRQKIEVVTELQVVPREGPPVTVQVTTVPVRRFSARVETFHTALVDLTARKRAEAAVLAAHVGVVNERNRLAAVMENLPVGVAILDSQGERVQRNAAFEQIWGSPLPPTGNVHENAAYQAWWADTGKPVQPDEWASARAVQHGESVVDQEMWIQRPDGSRAFILNSGVPIRDSQGRVIGSAVVVQDITARRRVEEAMRQSEERLRQSEALYRGIGESIDYGVWVCAPDGRNLYASPSFLNLVGQTQEQCSNFGWGDVLHPDDAARTIAAWKECVRTGGVWDIEHRYRGVDGQYHAILARGVAVKDDQGKIQCWAGINLDIGRLKQTEEQLRASERRLRLALEGGNLAAWDWHIPSGEVVWNDEHYRMLGYAVGEVTPSYQAWADRVHPEDRPRVEAAIRHSMDQGVDYSTEFRVVCPDGTTRWIETRGRFEHDAAGKALRCYGVMLDLTGRKQAEAERERLLAELSAEKNRWQAMVENMLDPVTVCDAQGSVTYMNPAYSQLVGRPIPPGLEVKNHPNYYQIYRPDGTLFPPEELPLQKAARSGQELRQVEVVQRTADGRQFVALFNAAPVRGPAGQVSGAVAVGRDITEQRRAEEALRALNAELEQRVAAQTAEIRQASEELARRVNDLARANAELESFSYSASHDLRAPLRQVMGFVTQLGATVAGRLDAEGVEYIQLIQTAVTRMGRLIDDLLAFSRVGRAEMSHERVDLRSLVDQAVEVLGPAGAGRAIDWVIGPLPQVNGDAALLRQVFVCLLDNALKFTRPRARAKIEIEGSTRGGEHVIFVRDNGVGFNQRYVGKIYGVFQRLHGPGEFEGTGIGLANVQRIIQRHLGRVWAEGVEGQGATFYFSLPSEPPRAVQPNEEES